MHAVLPAQPAVLVTCPPNADGYGTASSTKLLPSELHPQPRNFACPEKRFGYLTSAQISAVIADTRMRFLGTFHQRRDAGDAWLTNRSPQKVFARSGCGGWVLESPVRASTGAFSPILGWLRYGDHQLAPLPRSEPGSFTAILEWLHGGSR